MGAVGRRALARQGEGRHILLGGLRHRQRPPHAGKNVHTGVLFCHRSGRRGLRRKSLARISERVGVLGNHAVLLGSPQGTHTYTFTNTNINKGGTSKRQAFKKQRDCCQVSRVAWRLFSSFPASCSPTTIIIQVCPPWPLSTLSALRLRVPASLSSKPA